MDKAEALSKWPVGSWWIGKQNFDFRARRFRGIDDKGRTVAFDMGVGTKVQYMSAWKWTDYAGRQITPEEGQNLFDRWKRYAPGPKSNYVVVCRDDLIRMIADYDKAVAAVGEHYENAKLLAQLVPEHVEVGPAHERYTQEMDYVNTIKREFGNIIAETLGLLATMQDVELQSMLDDEFDLDVRHLAAKMGYARMMIRASATWYNMDHTTSLTVGPPLTKVRSLRQRILDFVRTLKFVQ